MAQACMAIGYFDDTNQARHRQAVLDIGQQAFEPFSRVGAYDFGNSDLPERIRATALALGMDREFWKIPPADAMLLQRKFGGLYLLAIRLKARVNVNDLAKAALQPRRRSR
jgi:hypothetical protein